VSLTEDRQRLVSATERTNVSAGGPLYWPGRCVPLAPVLGFGCVRVATASCTRVTDSRPYWPFVRGVCVCNAHQLRAFPLL
jgi:hypothetical protein